MNKFQRKTSKICLLILILLGITSLGAKSVLATTTAMSVLAPSEVSPGQTFDVDINIDSGSGIAGAQFSLSFDGTLLMATNVSDGGYLSQSGAVSFFLPGSINSSSIQGVAGAITVPNQQVSGSGTFARITFVALSKVGTSQLTLSNVIAGDINGSSIGVSFSNSQVQVSNAVSSNATVVLGGLAQTFDGTPKAVTTTTIPLGLNVSVTYNGSATVPVSAGNYTVVGTIVDNNYQGATTGTMVVAKATPKITWNNPANFTYGTLLSSTQLNANANLPGTFVYTPPVGVVLGSGPQTLAVAFYPSDATNYSVNTTTATVNVTKLTIIPSVTTANKIYDGTTTANIITRTLSGIINGDDVILSGGTAKFDTAAVDSAKTVTVNGFSLSGVTAGNYILSSTTLITTANITKASLSAAADNKTITVGGADPVFTISYSGFVAGQDKSVLQTAPTAKVSASHTSAGSYPITVSGGSDTNYSFIYVGGTLTVNAASSGGGGGGGGGGGFGSQLVGIGLSGTSPFMDGNGKAVTPGQIGTADGTLSLDIPVGSYVWNAAGAAQPFLSASVLAEPPQAPAQNTLVVAYEMGPNGVTFNPAISLTLKYTDSQLPAGANESDLYISWWDGAKWVKLTSIVDTAANTVTAQVSHFTSFALMAPAAPPIPLPTIKINSPSTGATFDTGNITMTVNVGNLNLVAAGRPNTAGEGRIIYYLDVPSIPTTPGVSALSAPGTYQEAGVVSNTWANLSPGNHTLGVQIVQNDLTPFNPPVYATINLVINGPSVVLTTSAPTQIPLSTSALSTGIISWKVLAQLIGIALLISAIISGMLLLHRRRLKCKL